MLFRISHSLLRKGWATRGVLPPGSESYSTVPALGSPVHLRGESRWEEGADEIVIRVTKGVVLIEVK